MDDGLVRRETCRPRRVSAAAELGANASPQDGEAWDQTSARESRPAAGRARTAAGRPQDGEMPDLTCAWESRPAADRARAAALRTDRRSSVPPAVHQRHMPMEPNKFHIPRKTKEKKSLFQYVSTESREFEDMKTILSSSYIDISSAGCFAYSSPRLVHSELLEKEFVEKRKEMKAEGRTDKELEESYCFLLTNAEELPLLCEKGLTLGQSRMTLLGNPTKATVHWVCSPIEPDGRRAGSGRAVPG